MLSESDLDSDSDDDNESESDNSDGEDHNDSNDPYIFNVDDIDWDGLTNTFEQICLVM